MTTTLIISDIHIGDIRFNTADIIKVLKNENYDRLILNGDIIDVWLADINTIKKDPLVGVIAEISNSKEVLWVLGNHDSDSDLFGDKVKRVNKAEFNHNDCKFLAVHGHEVYPHKNNTWWDRLCAKIGNKLYKWFRLNLQVWARKTLLYKCKAMDMRLKLIQKYDKKYSYIIMGHTHVPEYLSSEHTSLLDAGCPHIAKTYVLIQDDIVYIRRIDDCTGN